MIAWGYLIPAFIVGFVSALGLINYIDEQNDIPVDHSGDSDNVTSNDSTED